MKNNILSQEMTAKFERYKTIWRRLSKEGRSHVASKAQRTVSYCSFIAGCKNRPDQIKNSTIYDLCEFASLEFEKEFNRISKEIHRSDIFEISND